MTDSRISRHVDIAAFLIMAEPVERVFGDAGFWTECTKSEKPSTYFDNVIAQLLAF